MVTSLLARRGLTEAPSTALALHPSWTARYGQPRQEELEPLSVSCCLLENLVKS